MLVPITLFWIGTLPYQNEAWSQSYSVLCHIVYLDYVFFCVQEEEEQEKMTKKIKCNSATLLCGLMSVVFCDDAALRHCLSVSGARHLIPIPQSVPWTHTTTSSWNIPPDSTHSLCYQRGVQRCERTHAFSKRLKKENLLSRTSANFLGYATKFEV